MFKCLVAVCFSAGSVISQIVDSNIAGAVKGSIIDLGYSQYQGYVDENSKQEFWLGVRFAAPPQRWQAPIKPLVNRTSVIQANQYGSVCYQAPQGTPGAVEGSGGSEDCLFLNVWRPSNVTGSLPILFYIHGGGYGIGNNQYDPTFLQQISPEPFMFVTIQYRLGAFGFLSSADVFDNGVVNAGLLDQNRALQWVQEHISAFGGDPDQVTIFGESAGAGSVMQNLLSYGGQVGTSLFRRGMMASPYLPKQYKYNDNVPTKFYYLFAKQVGCMDAPDNFESIFACLTLADTHTLANASFEVSTSDVFGNWAFIPVTDGIYSIMEPSAQLLSGKLNGEAVLVGNNALEGDIFTSLNITTSADFLSYIKTYLPNLNTAGINRVLNYYPEPAASGGLYTTQFARAAQFESDAQFVCPGVWIADAYNVSYRYLFAVPTPYHATDIPFYLPSAADAFPTGLLSFAKEFDSALLGFVLYGTPNVSDTSVSSFPRWNSPVYGSEVIFNVSDVTTRPYKYSDLNTVEAITGMPNITVGSGVQLTNGLNRCDFWEAIAPIVPM